MTPNPWESPKKGKKIKKKVPSVPVPNDEVDWKAIHHIDTYKSHPSGFFIVDSLGEYNHSAVTVVNEQWHDMYGVFSDWMDKWELCIPRRKTPEERAQLYVDQYPGAATVDLMVSYANDEKRKLNKELQKEIDDRVGAHRFTLQLNHSLSKENDELREEVYELRAQLSNRQIQHEKIVSCSITAIETTRHFRDE